MPQPFAISLGPPRVATRNLVGICIRSWNAWKGSCLHWPRAAAQGNRQAPRETQFERLLERFVKAPGISAFPKHIAVVVDISRNWRARPREHGRCRRFNPYNATIESPDFLSF